MEFLWLNNLKDQTMEFLWLNNKISHLFITFARHKMGFFLDLFLFAALAWAGAGILFIFCYFK